MFLILCNKLSGYSKIVIHRQLCLFNFKARLIIFFPADPLLQFMQLHSFIFPKTVAKDHLKDTLLIFTDGSSNGRAAYVVNGEGHEVQTEPASAQVVELWL